MTGPRSVWSRRRLTLALYVGLVAALAGYAAVDELLQTPLPQRVADPLDWLADVTGAAFGAAVFALIVAVGRSLRPKIWPQNGCQTPAEKCS